MIRVYICCVVLAMLLTPAAKAAESPPFGCNDAVTLQTMRDVIEEIYAPHYQNMATAARMTIPALRKHIDFSLDERAVRPIGFDRVNHIFECRVGMIVKVSDEWKREPVWRAVDACAANGCQQFNFLVQTIPGSDKPLIQVFEIHGERKRIY